MTGPYLVGAGLWVAFVGTVRVDIERTHSKAWVWRARSVDEWGAARTVAACADDARRRLESELVKGRAPEGRLPPPSAVAGESGQRLGSPVGYPNNAVAAVEE